MTLISKTYWGSIPFNFRRPPDDAGSESLVLRADDMRQFRATYWTPRSGPAPRVAVVCMHPRVDFTHHYTFPRLLAAGIACLGANTRNPNNDLDTEHEAIALDVAAAVRYLRQKRGIEQVVLLGNSGGGSLSGLFQAQAIAAPVERIEYSPAGTPTRFAQSEMIPADGMVYIAAHRGQGRVLAECIDPAVTDERDPFATDASLDMYDPRNGFRPPPEWSEYSSAFVARYRGAQLERVRRLDATAREWLAGAREAAAAADSPGFEQRPFDEQHRVRKRQAFEPVMVVYRTMANLHYVDRHLDPSDREYGSLLSDRPDLMNMTVLGFARTVTPRAWLSTWSALSSNADLLANVARIHTPTLVVTTGRDREIYPRTDAQPLFSAVASADKTLVDLVGARHYCEPDFGEKATPDIDRLMDAVVPWIRDRFFAAGT